MTALAAALLFAAVFSVAGIGVPSAHAAAKHGTPHGAKRHVRARHRARKADDSTQGLGQLSGLLPRDHLTTESALQVNLSNETVRLPLYPGKAPDGTKVWYVLLDASDSGLAHDLGVNYAPKLSNLAQRLRRLRAERQAREPLPDRQQVRAGRRRLRRRPGLQPEPRRRAGPNGFPLKSFQPGAVAGPGYSPFIRIEGSPVVYNAPIVATGDGPFDVDHHSNTGDRVLDVHIGDRSPQGQFNESWADLLLVKGFDAGQPILYLEHRRRPAADLGARALDLRTRPRSRPHQRRR